MGEWNTRDLEQFHRKFSSGFYWRVIPFQHILKSLPKCPFSVSSETVISNCSVERMI